VTLFFFFWRPKIFNSIHVSLLPIFLQDKIYQQNLLFLHQNFRLLIAIALAGWKSTIEFFFCTVVFASTKIRSHCCSCVGITRSVNTIALVLARPKTLFLASWNYLFQYSAFWLLLMFNSTFLPILSASANDFAGFLSLFSNHPLTHTCLHKGNLPGQGLSPGCEGIMPRPYSTSLLPSNPTFILINEKFCRWLHETPIVTPLTPTFHQYGAGVYMPYHLPNSALTKTPPPLSQSML